MPKFIIVQNRKPWNKAVAWLYNRAAIMLEEEDLVSIWQIQTDLTFYWKKHCESIGYDASRVDISDASALYIRSNEPEARSVEKKDCYDINDPINFL